MSRILVVGAGRLGLPLARMLHESGHQVTAIRRSPPPSDIAGIQWQLLDLRERDGLQKLGREFDQVIIILTPAARSPEGYRQIYQQALEDLLRHLDGAGARPACLFVSATSVYAQNDGSRVDEESETRPVTYNGRSLLAAEQRILGWSPAPLVVRFAGIYGPERRRLLDQLAKPLSIQRSPPLYTNRVHQADCVAMLDFLAARQRAGSNRHKIYIGADSDPAEKFEMMSWLADAAGLTPPVPVDAPDDAPRNKRCCNRRLLESGYDLIYPGYRDGYRAMLAPDGCA
jgi:nucleoside-diphosphate-sugar epimerase